MVPFCVIVHYVFGYRCAQASLTERYEAVETLSTYGENESFRVCVQIRTIRGKAKGIPSINSSCMRLANFLQPECFGRLHVGRFKSRRRLYSGIEV